MVLHAGEDIPATRLRTEGELQLLRILLKGGVHIADAGRAVVEQRPVTPRARSKLVRISLPDCNGGPLRLAGTERILECVRIHHLVQPLLEITLSVGTSAKL